MDSVSIYLTVGALSFVKCEFSQSFYSNLIKPSEFTNHNRYHKDDGERRRAEENPTTANEIDIYKSTKPNWDASIHNLISSSADEPENGNGYLFGEGFHRFKSIIDQCRTKVNKRIKKFFKVKVEPNEMLSDWKNYVLSVYKCVKVYSFRYLDEMLEEEIVPVSDYAYFIKDNINVSHALENYGREISTWNNAEKGRQSVREYAKNILNKDWSVLVYERLDNLLKSHSLKLQVDKSLTEGRGRRRDHRMFAMLVMGFMIMASILIPMGFQFLTVLGGKSLLMAKMALIMSAISGLKKIATSNVGYGFYQTANDAHHHDHPYHGFHEKLYNVNSQNNQPYGFNV